MSEILLGSHLGLGAPDYFLGTAKEAASYGETALMFYTGAPQNTKRQPTSIMKIKEGQGFLKEHGISLGATVVHAPYIINIANTLKPEIGALAKDFLISELKRTADFGSKLLVLHPGSAAGAPREEAIEAAAERLDAALSEDGTDVTVCLETMAGKGSEIGSSFEELSEIFGRVKHKERIGFCLDTCHISDAGYDVADVKGVLEEFDRALGLDRLKVIHLNDSKNERGSHKDRHENIGYGTIGFKTLCAWAHEESLSSVPKILETPHIKNGDDSIIPYKVEISMLREGAYKEGWREALVKASKSPR
jgi:deoxyribonuclease-4